MTAAGNAGAVDGASCDEILRGRLKLWQPARGYRFNVDSLLLAHFAAAHLDGARAPKAIVDLCAGVGVIGLALAARWPSSTVTLAELQPAMAALARRNARENRLGARARVVEVDLADARAARARLPGASCELVVASPPYFTVDAGPTVGDAGEAIARHEVRMGLADLAREARRLLVPGGRAAIVFPSERLPALLAALEAESLQPSRLRLIHPKPGADANRALVEAVKGAKCALTVGAPFFLREAGGDYSLEAREALGES